MSPSFGLVGLAVATDTAGNGRACARQEAAAVYQQPKTPPTAAFCHGRYHRLVRRLLTWVVVTLGIAALIRRLRRRSRDQEARPTPGRAPRSRPTPRTTRPTSSGGSSPRPAPRTSRSAVRPARVLGGGAAGRGPRPGTRGARRDERARRELERHGRPFRDDAAFGRLARARPGRAPRGDQGGLVRDRRLAVRAPGLEGAGARAPGSRPRRPRVGRPRVRAPRELALDPLAGRPGAAAARRPEAPAGGRLPRRRRRSRSRSPSSIRS